MVKQIELTQGYVAIVDDEDYELLAQYRWKVTFSSSRMYATRTIKKVKVQIMHRVILNAKPGEFVDHINGDGLDNRRANIRICTREQNAGNIHTPAKGTSVYRGVYWDTSNKWKASIGTGKNKNGVYSSKCLGRFNSETEAAKAYDVAAREKYGAFAKLNFPSPPEPAISASLQAQWINYVPPLVSQEAGVPWEGPQ